MLAPRTDHVCIALDDGTVLVAGGATSRDSVTNAAEIFHPDANSWTPAGAYADSAPQRRDHPSE